MTAKKGALYAIALVLSTSCSAGLFDDLGQAEADPFIKAPTVESFRTEDVITVSWEDDPGASEYILERSLDQATPVYSMLYRGAEQIFVDTSGETDMRYLYRLTKVRGERLFGPSPAALGVCSASRRDANEPNDTEVTAVPMNTYIEANTFFYRANTGEVVSDTDWYTIEVPARATASIVVELILPAGDATTYMYYYRTGTVPSAVVNADPILIENTGYSAKTFSFSLYPHGENFVGGAGAGGMLKGYTIQLLQISWI
ncbi:MAG: hypothetical protein CVV47_04520 [Spirochaetae bacterium HGW-Spirochaetae-3]|nr:MAG: hypothetical protein CVV47_04520 [Spirochaetae bacterium HGW-Spirochaetae-3]